MHCQVGFYCITSVRTGRIFHWFSRHATQYNEGEGGGGGVGGGVGACVCELTVSWPFSGPFGATKYGSGWRKDVVNQYLEFGYCHTPSIAFRHLPPNSARFSYASEGALFISAQLSAVGVSALRKVREYMIRLRKQPSAQAPTSNMRRIHPGLKRKEKKEEFRLDSNDFGLICAGISNMVSYETNVWYNLSCL